MNACWTPMLINPYNHQSLTYETWDGNEFLSDTEGNTIPFKNGIPDFLVLEHVDGLNQKYKQFYDRISLFNDAAEALYKLFIDLDKLRMKWMSELEIRSGYNVLETSVGTGWNVRVLPENAHYFGLDISDGMLRQCAKNIKKWNRPVELFQGNAEYLPFKDNSFDSVFHVGGINFFNNRGQAIREMIRVAKPGTKIVIIDEMEKQVRNKYQRLPFVSHFYRKEDVDTSLLVPPAEFVPKEMENIQVKMFDREKMYQLSFRKPIQAVI